VTRERSVEDTGYDDLSEPLLDDDSSRRIDDSERSGSFDDYDLLFPTRFNGRKEEGCGT
jgi:hypothetical protein